MKNDFSKYPNIECFISALNVFHLSLENSIGNIFKIFIALTSNDSLLIFDLKDGSEKRLLKILLGLFDLIILFNTSLSSHMTVNTKHINW